MWNRRRSSTRGLTSSELVISDSRRLVKLLTAMLVLMLIALMTSLSLLFTAELESPQAATTPGSDGALEASDRSGSGDSDSGDDRVALLEGQNVQLQAQVKALQDALNGATLDLEVERATRGELELQINGLREHLVQTQEELAFLKSAGNGATKP